MKEYFKKFLEANKGNKNFVMAILIIAAIFFGKNLLSIIFNDPGIFLKIPILLISITLHEIAHGYAAYLSGDNTAKNMGRLSLNPLKHIDAAGFILPVLLILSGSNFIIGWAKPVPVNYYNLKNGRLGEFFISISGVLTNFILSIVGVLLLKFLPNTEFMNFLVPYIIYFISFNIMIGVFNLLPIPPLDGSKIIASFAPESLRETIFGLERYGFFIILILAYFGLIGSFVYPIYIFIINLLDKFI